MIYYPIYTSATRSQSNCVKSFVDSERESKESIPTSVEAYCDICDKRHGFNLKNTFMVMGGSNLKSLKNYCERNAIEFK